MKDRASNADREVLKFGVLAALRARLESTLAGLVEAQRSAQTGAIHPEARQEHPKDTRAIEAGYLARGLAERVEVLRDGITSLAALRPRAFTAADPLAVGALAGLEDREGTATVVLLAPAGGGERIEIEGGVVLVLTPGSPLGAALAGRRPGDDVEVALPGGRRTLTIEWVA
jgi:hypothetical protein